MQFFANPYDTSATGFYFESFAEYEEKRDALRNSIGLPVEEFEIDVIDGTQEEVQLAAVMEINQGNLERCLEVLESSDDSEWPALFYLLDNRVVNDLDDALSKINDVCLYPGTLIDAATELFDECYAHEIPESVRCYIDYESFARDCRIGGDMCEFKFGGNTFTCTNANGI